MLTERQLEVVLSVVSEFIQSGENVGSRTISKRYLTGSSAATIRNEMADLEEMGYLLQPHTSSGRIPTTLAYRLYVDSVLQNRRPLEADVQERSHQLQDRRRGIETFLSYASELLGNLSNYMGVAAVTQLRELRFHRVDFIRLDTTNILLLIVLEAGYVHHRVIPMPYDLSQDFLEELTRKINSFAGCMWSEVRETLQEYIVQELGAYEIACRHALTELNGMLSSPTTRLVTSSMSQLLNLPDFQDMARIKALFSILEQEEGLANLVKDCSAQNGVHVVIGEENKLPEMRHCSLVLASSGDTDQRTVLGIIGPQRMDYEKVITVLDKVLAELSVNETS